MTNAAMDCRPVCAIAHTKNAGDMYNRTPPTVADSPSPLVIALSSRPWAMALPLDPLGVVMGAHTGHFLPTCLS